MNLFNDTYSAWNTMGLPTMRDQRGRTHVPTRQIEVQGDCLDHFCDRRNIGHIDFLKVDVEGFEE